MILSMIYDLMFRPYKRDDKIHIKYIEILKSKFMEVSAFSELTK